MPIQFLAQFGEDMVVKIFVIVNVVIKNHFPMAEVRLEKHRDWNSLRTPGGQVR
jgi:hypothetical protein